MELTSEQVHWLGGVAFVVVIGLLIAQHAGVARWRGIPWLLPVLLVGYGIESRLDWWIHGDARPKHLFPAGAAARAARQRDAHPRTGGRRAPARAPAGGGLRLRVARGAHPCGHCVLGPFATRGAVDPMVMMIQHRAFAIALVVAALMLTLEISGRRRGFLECAWLAPLLIFGGIPLIYTESGTMAGMDHSVAPMSSH